MIFLDDARYFGIILLILIKENNNEQVLCICHNSSDKRVVPYFPNKFAKERNEELFVRVKSYTIKTLNERNGLNIKKKRIQIFIGEKRKREDKRIRNEEEDEASRVIYRYLLGRHMRFTGKFKASLPNNKPHSRRSYKFT